MSGADRGESVGVAAQGGAGSSVPAPLRIGLLGASRIAELAVTEASRETGDVRAAVAARDPERARAYAAEHGYEGVRESYEALIADDSLDLVYIGLPNGLHAEWTVRALAAGRSVLVEKPFAANLAEFEAVVAVLTGEGDGGPAGWAWEAFHYADHPLMPRLIEVVRSGEIGDVREVRVAMMMPAPPATDPRWSFDLAGGAMMDLGCYAINALLVLGDALGTPLELLSAEADPYGPDARVDASVRAEFALGRVPVSMRTSMESPEWDFGLEVVGSAGSVFAPNFVKPQEDDRLIVRASETGSERVERLGEVSSYTYQLRRIREAVRALGDTEHPEHEHPQHEHAAHERRAAAHARALADLDRSRRTMQLIDEVYEASGLPLRPGRLA